MATTDTENGTVLTADGTPLAKQIAEQEKTAELQSAQEIDDTRKALRLDWGDTLEERESLVRGWMEKSEAPDNLKELMTKRELPVETMNWLYNTAKQFKSDVTPISSDGSTPTPWMKSARSCILSGTC